MEQIDKNRKRQKGDFRKLLAKCMAKALFTYDKREQSDDPPLNTKTYRDTVNRLENDILLDEEEGTQAF